MRFELPKFRLGRQIFGGKNAQTRPLNLCPICNYVLCGCGSCHSEECHQECQYTPEESERITQANVEMSEHLKNLLANRLED